MFSGHGPERQLLSPQVLPPDMQDYPTLNETCVLRESNRDEYALMKRQGSWIGAWVRSGRYNTAHYRFCIILLHGYMICMLNRESSLKCSFS